VSQSPTSEAWDETVDFLVVGSGGAGLGGALRAHDLGASVLIVEKSDRWGGSTAMSGGVVWMPVNPDMGARGIADDREAALTYLREITKGEVPEARLQAYVDRSREVWTWLHGETKVELGALDKYTDYYPEAPGGRPGGRSTECPRFDATVLGKDNFATLRRPHPQSQIMGKFGITAREAHGYLVDSWGTKLRLMWRMVQFLFRRGKAKAWGRDVVLTAGNSLMARMGRSLMDRELWPRLGWGAQALIQADDGTVLGCVIEGPDGETRRVRARRGVLLAAGGFERNQKWRSRYQKAPIRTDWSAASDANTGIGIQLGMDAGGAVQLMDEAWWTPATMVPRSEVAWVLVVEKNLPGGLFVNSEGERFTNEAAPYIDVVNGMYAGAGGPCHMVFDAEFRQRYPVGPVAPGYASPDSRTPRRYREGFFKKADTIAGLAEKIDVPADALQATIERFNTMARKGVDEDFGRGHSQADRYYGDPRIEPNPCMRPLEQGPFYAIEVVPGDLGTKGGLVTDAQARVLREDGTPIPGLFAAGNCSSAVMGRSYPGAGGTIGPAIVFGFVAAETACATQASAQEVA